MNENNIVEKKYMCFSITGVDFGEDPPLIGNDYVCFVNNQTGIIELAFLANIMNMNMSNPYLYDVEYTINDRDEGWYVPIRDWGLEFYETDDYRTRWDRFNVMISNGNGIASNELINSFSSIDGLEFDALIVDNIYSIIHTYLNTQDEDIKSCIIFEPTTRETVDILYRLLISGYDVPDHIEDIMLQQSEIATQVDIDALGLHISPENADGSVSTFITFDNISEFNDDNLSISEIIDGKRGRPVVKLKSKKKSKRKSKSTRKKFRKSRRKSPKRK